MPMGKKTSQVVEALDNRQYLARIDGSNWVTQSNRCFLLKIHPVIDSPYYPQLEGLSESLETAKVLTIPRLQHAESQPTHDQPEASDIVPMVVEEVKSNEDKDNVTVMEVDKDQNQPPSNQASHQSTSVTTTQGLIPAWRVSKTVRMLLVHDYNPNVLGSHGGGGACEGMEEH